MKKILALTLVMVMAFGLLAGCDQTEIADTPPVTSQSPGSSGSSSSPSPGTSGGDPAGINETEPIRFNWRSSIGTDTMLDCPWTSAGENIYIYMVYSRLFELTNEGTPVPDLASDWTISADKLTYTFTLVDNAKWHDGTPVTADDIVWSINAMAKLPSTMYYMMTPIMCLAGAQAVADGNATSISGLTASGNTVTMKLDAESRNFFSDLAYLYFLPKHLLESIDPATLDQYEGFWSSPVGSGAYKVNELRYPDYFTLVRHDGWHRPLASVKNILFTSYYSGGDTAAINAMIAGQLDVECKAMNDINVAKHAVTQNSELAFDLFDGGGYRNIMLNAAGSADGRHHPDMMKKEVRQAINLLLDKQAIADFFEGQASPLSSLLPVSYPQYNTDIPPHRRDVAKARQLLDEAGFDFSRPIRFAYYHDDPTTADIMEVFRAQFADVGITLETIFLQGDLLDLIYYSVNYDLLLARAGVGPSSGDPIQYAYAQFKPADALTDNVYGDIAVRNQVFAPIIEKYLAATDPTELKKLGDEIQLLGLEYVYTIPVYGERNIVVYNASRVAKEGNWNLIHDEVGPKNFDTWAILR